MSLYFDNFLTSNQVAKSNVIDKYNTIIIGSGISGLFTLKHLIDEGNTNVLVLDKNPEPFGVWNINNKPSVFENTYAVSSKLYMTISDFPIPEEYPEFPHHSLILQYYKNYAKHFNLYSYLRQNVEVISVHLFSFKLPINV